MPKRRITTAKQRAASRANLKKARAARKPNRAVAREQAHIDALAKKVGTLDMTKPMPSGKTVLVMHRTTKAAAGAIVKSGFKTDQRNTPYTNAREGQFMYGVRAPVVRNWRGYGEAIVGVKVPRRMVSTDASMSTYYPPPVKVAVRNLKGRKFKRYTEPKASRGRRVRITKGNFSALFE